MCRAFGRPRLITGLPDQRFIPAFAKNILLLHIGINDLLFRFAWCTNARPSRDAFIHCKLKIGEILMKTALIRILAIATLAGSMSAFAATEEPKHDAATT